MQKLIFMLIILPQLLFGLGSTRCLQAIDGDTIHKASKAQKTWIYAQAGLNITSIQHKNSDWQSGYTAGLSVFTKITNRLRLGIYALVLKENTYLHHIKGQYYNALDELCYTKYYDLDFSIRFFEFPAVLYFRLWQNKVSSLYMGLGTGYAIANKDRSKRTNHHFTDELITDSYCTGFAPGDYYENEENEEKSGFALTAGIVLTYKRVAIHMLYMNKRYGIEGYGKHHTVSVQLGYRIDPAAIFRAGGQ